MKNRRFIPVIFLLALVFPVSRVLAGGGHDHGHGHSHDDHGHEEEAEKKGPHGGRLLEKDNFTAEVTIFESRTAPHFRLYFFHGEKPVAPEKVKASLTLVRFGGRTERLSFSAEKNYLKSDQEAAEPHSFDVRISAEFEGAKYEWEYSSYEGRTEMSHEALKVAALSFETAGPAEISATARVYGRLLPNENKVAHIVPRFPGIIKEINKQLGDPVKKGELLAIIESNQSLQPYEIRSQLEGVVINRHATAGEFVTDSRELFVVADLSEVWADFQVYRDDFDLIEAGQAITVDLGDGKEIPATVTYTSPVIDEATQSKLIRAVLPNTSSTLRPGLFISGVLSSPEGAVPVAVKREAIQTFRDWNVVFLTDGHVFQAVPVELGRKDPRYAEILSGIKAGDRYVSRNSFIVKADIEKSGASHDH